MSKPSQERNTERGGETQRDTENEERAIHMIGSIQAEKRGRGSERETQRGRHRERKRERIEKEERERAIHTIGRTRAEKR